MPFSFGNTSSSSTSGFGGFGATSKPSTTGFGGFGSTSTGGGFSGFGAKTTASTGFSFGTPSTATSTGGGLFSGFGSTTKTTASTGFGGFGTGTTTGFGGFGAKTTASTFGGFGTTTTSASGFGTTGSLFGGLNKTTTASTGFSLSNPTQPGWNAGQQQQQPAQGLDNPLASMTSALTMPTIFGDERDGIIAKLNQLQALWGEGKAVYSHNAQPIPLSQENPFSRFKTIGYSCLPSAKDSDGFVSFDLKHKEDYVKTNQQQFVESISKIMGNKPTFSVCVDGLRSLPGDRSEIVIYVVERQSNGSSRRILATELYAFFSQQNIKAQLTQLGVENMVAKTTLSESQLKQFLDTPPLGIDAILWEQAKKDNPDPKNLIPVPIMGFNELLTRLKHQQYQNTQHKRRLEILNEEISKLQSCQSTTIAKLAQYKRKHLELAHRTLQVMTQLETIRKGGYSIEPDEEQLRIQLESLQAELNAPMQFKGRLNELISQIRLQSQVKKSSSNISYSLDEQAKHEAKQFLSKQQEALLQLVSIINEDFEDLKTIESGMIDSLYIRR